MVTFEQNGHKRGGVVVHPSPFFFFASGSRDNKAVRRLTDRLVVCLCERSVDAVRVNVMLVRPQGDRVASGIDAGFYQRPVLGWIGFELDAPRCVASPSCLIPSMLGLSCPVPPSDLDSVSFDFLSLIEHRLVVHAPHHSPGWPVK